MLLPTQQSFGLAATSAMQSMLDGIEEQRRQDEESRTGRERDKMTEARISASEEAKRANEKIASALFGVGKVDANELRIQLSERLAAKLGMDLDDARSSYKLGKALEDALKNDPNFKKVIEEELGLKEMGITAETLLAAIRNPYGDDSERLKSALLKKANGNTLDTEVERVVQRMEDTANPKTLEELKLGPQGYDPARVEDAEVRAERREDIKAAEAGENLEDVRKTQDVIEKKNDAKAETASDTTGSPDAGETSETEMITVLAVAAEQIEIADKTETADAEIEAVTDSVQADDTVSAARALIADDVAKSEASEKIADTFMADASEASMGDGVLPVRIDDIGLYELLKKKLAA